MYFFQLILKFIDFIDSFKYLKIIPENSLLIKNHKKCYKLANVFRAIKRKKQIVMTFIKKDKNESKNDDLSNKHVLRKRKMK